MTISNYNISNENITLWENIFFSLNKNDLLSCRHTCRLFHAVIAQNIGFQQLLDLYNTVIVSCNVIESKHWKQQLLKSAQQSVEISGNFCGGEIFRHYLSIVEYKLQDLTTFKAHIISSKILLEEKDISALNALKTKYSSRFYFIVTSPKLTWKRKILENHMKLLIVDNQYFMVGGTGFQDNLLSDDPHFVSTHRAGQFSASAHQDMDLVGKGSLSPHLRHVFFDLLQQLETEESGKSQIKNRYFSLLGKKGNCEDFDTSEKSIKDVHLTAYTSFPRQEKDEITPTIISLFNEAEKNIVVASLGFNPVSKVINALKNRKIGVSSTLITNSPTAAKTCIKIYGLASAPYYSYFDQVFIYNRNNTLYHTKLVTIDEKTALIGSYNLTPKSGASTYEIMLRIDDPRVVHVLLEQLQKDMDNSRIFQMKEQSFIHNGVGKSLSALFGEFL